MAKKHPAAGSPPSGGRRSRKPQGRSPSTIVYVRIDPALAAALEAHIKSVRPRTNKTAVVEAALEDYLRKLGAWPPKVP